MKTILTTLLLITYYVSSAQTGMLMQRYYITGSLSIGSNSRAFADSSAWLQVGADTTDKGVLLPKVLLDSVQTTARGLYVYDLVDSVLYHMDGTNRVRYMTYKDTVLIKELIANADINLSDYYKNNGNSFGATAVLGTTDSNDLQIITNDTPRAVIRKDGKWLVNTTVPSVYNFDINGTARVKGLSVDEDATSTALTQQSTTANNFFRGNTYFGTNSTTYNDKVFVDGSMRASGNIGGSRVYVSPFYGFGVGGQYMTGDAGGGHFDFWNEASTGGGGGFNYRWYQNGGLGMMLSEDNNLLLGTAVNGIYKLDVNGKGHISDDLYIDKALIFNNNTQGIQLLDGNTIYAYTSILIGRDNGGYPSAPGSRQIKIGNSNSSNLARIWQYIIGQSNDLSTAGNGVFVTGNFNNILSAEPSQYVIGESNTINFSASSTGRGQFIIGLNNSVLHPYSSIMGNNQQTTGSNQLIFADANENTHQGGYRDVYFGSGPVSNLSNGLGAPVTINSSGGNGTDKSGGLLRLAAGKGTGNAAPQDVIFATATSTSSGTTLQTLSDRWYIKGATGYLSNSATPTSLLDIAGAVGYSQLRLRISYTPSSTSDTNGATGDVAWDENYLYVKTPSGWKRTALTIF